MYARLINLFLSNTSYMLSIVRFVLRIIDQQSGSYIPFQARVWHTSYNNRRMDPDKRRLNRELSLPFEWTPLYRRWLQNVFNDKCIYCGRSNCMFHLDHIIPVSWSSCPGGTVDNGVLACAECNMARGNQDLATWHLATFKSQKRTEQVVEKVWNTQKAARARFGEPDDKTRKIMQDVGKKMLRSRLRKYNKGKRR